MRLGSSFLLDAALIGLVACTSSPASRTARPDSAIGARDSLEAAEARLTDHYVKLLRAQLTATDPYQATVLIYCEQLRLMDLLASQADNPLEGENRATRLLRAADQRAYTPADARARRRVDSALAGKVFDADPGCDSLARAGLLGDTVMPPVRPR